MHLPVKNDSVRRRASCLAATLALVLLGLVTPALAQAESIEISHSANPTQDIPVSITVSGTADGNHKLYAYVNETESACPTDPFFNTGKTLVGRSTWLRLVQQGILVHAAYGDELHRLRLLG